MHDDLPILTNEANEYTHEAFGKAVKILSRTEALRIIKLNYLVVWVNLDLLSKKLNSEQAEHEHNDQEQDEKCNDIFQGLADFDHHLVESLPFPKQSEDP